MKRKPKGISYKLFKVMGIQLALISVVTLLSVYGAAKVVEDVLIKEALDGEAEFFWKHYEKDKDAKLPKTLNLTGYFFDARDLPQPFSEVTDGYHRVQFKQDRPLVHVSSKFDKQLILVFKEGQVARLAFYFGVAPLAFVLLIIYLPAWVSFVMSRRAISPVVKLARKVDDIEVSATSDLKADFSDIEKNADAEVLSLIKAFQHFSNEVTQYVHREKNFTRYASHELRTPLAVMKGSVALLSKQEMTDKNTRTLGRMSKVIDDMENLIDALLLLSRNQKVKTQDVEIDVAELIDKEIEQAKIRYPSKLLKIDFVKSARLSLPIPEYLLSVCISNILNNAINYDSSGKISIQLDDNAVSIKDSGKGIDKEALGKVFEPFYRGAKDRDNVKGFGLGLSIVKTICDRLGWKINVESEINTGTSVQLIFKTREQ